MNPLLAPLSDERAAAADALRQQTDATRCVFDWSLDGLPDGVPTATEAHHRAALQHLFERIRVRWEQGREQPIARRPEYADKPLWQLSVRFELASPSLLESTCVNELHVHQFGCHGSQPWARSTGSWAMQLAQAFANQPYPANCPPELFAQLCAVMGLFPGEGIEILDWVGNSETEPHRSTWSNYFDEGKEWWGIWCLTVWNPRQRTLAALAASTTD